MIPSLWWILKAKGKMARSQDFVALNKPSQAGCSRWFLLANPATASRQSAMTAMHPDSISLARITSRAYRLLDLEGQRN
jgi:hypothetical protein